MVINGKLIKVSNSNVNQLIKLVNVQINSFGEATKNSADSNSSAGETKDSAKSEDEKKRESLEAPVYLNFKEANQTSRYDIEKIPRGLINFLDFVERQWTLGST